MQLNSQEIKNEPLNYNLVHKNEFNPINNLDIKNFQYKTIIKNKDLNNKDNNSENNHIFETINFNNEKTKFLKIDKALNSLNLKNSTFLRMKNLYKKFLDFIDEIYKDKCDLNFPNNLDKKDLSVDLSYALVFVHQNYTNKLTVKRRKEQLRQIIRLITGNNTLDYPKSPSLNLEELNENYFPKDEEIIDILKQMNKNNDLSAIVLIQFILFLGLNIYQISRIKIKSFKITKNNIKILRINYNRKKIQRTLNDVLNYNVDKLIELYELNDNNYLFFPDIKNIGNNSRYLYIFNYMKKIIENSNNINNANKEKLIKMLKTERKAKTYRLIMADDASLFSELKEIDNNKNEQKQEEKNEITDNPRISDEIISFSLSSISHFNRESFLNNKRCFCSEFEGKTFTGFDINDENNNFSPYFNDLRINDLIWKNTFENYNDKKKNYNIPQTIILKDLKNNYSKNKVSASFTENINFTKEKNNINKLKLITLFKEINIKFIDEPFSLDEYLLYPSLDKNIPCPDILDGALLKIYKKAKRLTKNYIYPNLEVKKITDKIFRIEALHDILQGTFLFEVGGRIVTKEQLIINEQHLLLSNFCYYFLYPSSLEKDFRYILIQDEGNIAFYLKKTNEPLKNNVILKTYINEETKKLCLLCIACRKIKKSENLLVNTKYSLI